LIQRFEAVWSAEQHRGHLEAGRLIDKITKDAFAYAAKLVRSKTAFTEYDLQQWMAEQFRANGLVADSDPIVAVGPHSGDPHYEPKKGTASPIKEGDLLLLDVWGKLDKPDSVYYDITWMGYFGAKVPEKYAEVFGIAKQARDAAVSFAREATAAGRAFEGWQVDRAARDVIKKAGFGKYFVHRTGHSIGQEVHGAGANMDDLESHDVRRIIPGTCFSVEPGIYQAEFGVRTEVDVFVGEKEAGVTGAVQSEILALLT
jgi:Xaa-Pro aminopeptidase